MIDPKFQKLLERASQEISGAFQWVNHFTIAIGNGASCLVTPSLMARLQGERSSLSACIVPSGSPPWPITSLMVSTAPPTPYLTVHSSGHGVRIPLSTIPVLSDFSPEALRFEITPDGAARSTAPKMEVHYDWFLELALGQKPGKEGAPVGIADPVVVTAPETHPPPSVSASTKMRSPRIEGVVVGPELLRVTLDDCLVLKVPIFRFPWLAEAPREHQRYYRIQDDGSMIRWPTLGKGLSLVKLIIEAAGDTDTSAPAPKDPSPLSGVSVADINADQLRHEWSEGLNRTNPASMHPRDEKAAPGSPIFREFAPLASEAHHYLMRRVLTTARELEGLLLQLPKGRDQSLALTYLENAILRSRVAIGG